MVSRPIIPRPVVLVRVPMSRNVSQSHNLDRGARRALEARKRFEAQQMHSVSRSKMLGSTSPTSGTSVVDLDDSIACRRWLEIKSLVLFICAR